MKQMRILASMMVLSFALVPAGCNRNELASLKATLEKTETERDDLKAQVSAVTKSRDGLQKQLDELSASRGQLQEQLTELRSARQELQGQVDELSQSRTALEEQVAELTKSRDAALAEAQKAKGRIDMLAVQLDGETQKVRTLEDQLKQVQAAIAELQKKFSL